MKLNYVVSTTSIRCRVQLADPYVTLFDQLPRLKSVVIACASCACDPSSSVVWCGVDTNHCHGYLTSVNICNMSCTEVCNLLSCFFYFGYFIEVLVAEYIDSGYR